MSKNRLESFSDCIIAFAITLLILEIHIPELGPNADNHSMLIAVLGLLPNFAVYVISFLVCTVWWISHHTFIHSIHSVDRRLLWLNNIFLMLIAFIPFPTGLLGHHPGHPVATAFYGLVCALIGASFLSMRWYASGSGRLMNKSIPTAELRRSVRVSLLSPVLYLSGAVVSLFHPAVALCVYAAIPSCFCPEQSRSIDYTAHPGRGLEWLLNHFEVFLSRFAKTPHPSSHAGKGRHRG